MNGIILITHDGIGKAYLKCLKKILNKNLSDLYSINVLPIDSQNDANAKILRIIKKLKKCEGIVVLTDLYGSSPCNYVKKFIAKNFIVISGLNFNMLIRAVSYQDRSLFQLRDKIIDGAFAGIREVKRAAK